MSAGSAPRPRIAHGAGTPARCLAGGFTLVELLIAFSVLALLATLLAGSFQVAGRAWDAGHERADATDELRLVQGLLRRQLTTARPVFTALDNRRELQFEGKPDALRFITELPNHLGNGGLHEIRVTIEHAGREQQLVLAHLRFDAGRDEQPRDDDFRRVVLVERLKTARFEYYGAERVDGQPGWRDTWKSDQRLPTLVTLDVAEETRGEWPTLAVRLQVDRPSTVVAAGAGQDQQPVSDGADAAAEGGASPDGTTPGGAVPGGTVPDARSESNQ